MDVTRITSLDPDLCLASGHSSELTTTLPTFTLSTVVTEQLHKEASKVPETPMPSEIRRKSILECSNYQQGHCPIRDSLENDFQKSFR